MHDTVCRRYDAMTKRPRSDVLESPGAPRSVGDRSPARTAFLARTAVLMVNNAVGDRHRGYRRKCREPGDYERIGPVDARRRNRCLDDDRRSRPDAETTGTVVGMYRDDRGSRPDAERTGTIVGMYRDDRGSRPDAAGTGTIVRALSAQSCWHERCHHGQYDDSDKELRNCHGDHFLAPATDPGGRRQGSTLLCRHHHRMSVSFAAHRGLHCGTSGIPPIAPQRTAVSAQ